MLRLYISATVNARCTVITVLFLIHHFIGKSLNPMNIGFGVISMGGVSY